MIAALAESETRGGVRERSHAALSGACPPTMEEMRTARNDGENNGISCSSERQQLERCRAPNKLPALMLRDTCCRHNRCRGNRLCDGCSAIPSFHVRWSQAHGIRKHETSTLDGESEPRVWAKSVSARANRFLSAITWVVPADGGIWYHTEKVGDSLALETWGTWEMWEAFLPATALSIFNCVGAGALVPQ